MQIGRKYKPTNFFCDMKILITIVITSLVWIGVYSIYIDTFLQTEEASEQSESGGFGGFISKMSSESSISVEPEAQQPVTQQPEAQQPKVQQPKTPEKNYAELICGYWLPVEGTKSKLDISKYGTVTRYYQLYGGNFWYDDRNEYTISGNKLTVDSYYKCTVDVFEKDGITYLEVYGHEDYAGKYRKR